VFYRCAQKKKTVGAADRKAAKAVIIK